MLGTPMEDRIVSQKGLHDDIAKLCPNLTKGSTNIGTLSHKADRSTCRSQALFSSPFIRDLKLSVRIDPKVRGCLMALLLPGFPKIYLNWRILNLLVPQETVGSIQSQGHSVN